MKAKARKQHGTVRAFTGLTFVSYEWRPVPAGCEAEAMRLEEAGLLEFQGDPEKVIVLDLEPVIAPKKQQPPPPPFSQNVSPQADALAEREGIDLATVKGTGRGGRIVVRDIRKLAKEQD